MSVSEQPETLRRKTPGKRPGYLRGALPLLILIVIILILAALISARRDRLETIKTGLRSLEGVRLAAGNPERTAAIITASEDVNDAVKKLAAGLNLTAAQAKAVVHMPLSTFSGSERHKLDKQIAFLQQQIKDGKLAVETDSTDINVVAMELAPVTLRDRINLPGIVEPWIRFDIVAEVRGEVKRKRMDSGAAVRAGDVIAELDQRDYEIAVTAARASYDTALASLKRIEKLYAQKLASRSQMDDITAQTERFKAELDAAVLNLERCLIRCPVSGILNRVYVEQGQYVNVSDPVAELMDLDRVKVSVGIPESDVSAVAAVDEFEVRLDALAGKTFTGRKHFLSSAGDSDARLYKLEMAIDNPDHEILSDMFARVDIVKQRLENVLAVPLYSLITVNEQQTVYIVKEDVAHVRKVKTGTQEGWRMQITEGLEPGDRVIVVGHRRVSDGQKVNVIRTVSSMEEPVN